LEMLKGSVHCMCNSFKLFYWILCWIGPFSWITTWIHLISEPHSFTSCCGNSMDWNSSLWFSYSNIFNILNGKYFSLNHLNQINPFPPTHIMYVNIFSPTDEIKYKDN
jgi:hypothetical protein